MDNTLPSALNKYAPNANTQAIIFTGATAFRSVTDSADLPGVVFAYNLAITRTYVSSYILLPLFSVKKLIKQPVPCCGWSVRCFRCVLGYGMAED